MHSVGPFLRDSATSVETSNRPTRILHLMDSTRYQNLLKRILAGIEKTLKVIVPAIEEDEFHKLIVLRDRTGLLLKYVDRLDLRASEELMELAIEIRDLLDRRLRKSPPLDVSANRYISLIDHVNGLINLINGLIFGVKISSGDDIGDLVPDQKPAPFHFVFEQNRIIARDQLNTSDPAGGVLEVLIEQSDRILRDLQGANCSPRLKDAFVALHEKLVTGRNVLQVGVLNGSCSQLVAACADELSSTLQALLSAHHAGVSAFVAQFPEWRDFAANALETALDGEALNSLASSTRELSDRLKGHEDLIAPSVTDALDQVASWTEGSDRPNGRVVLAIARTLENLASLAMKTLSSFSAEVASEGKKMAAKAVVVILVGTTGAGLVSVMAKVPGAEWIRQSIDYFARSGQPK